MNKTDLPKTNLLVTSDNIDEAIALLTQKMSGKKYWSITVPGKIESLKDSPEIDLEKVFRVQIHKGNHPNVWKFVIEYFHENEDNIPCKSNYSSEYSQEIKIITNDIYIYEKDNLKISKKGGTTIFIECTEERVWLL